MKIRKLLVLLTVILLSAGLSVDAFAAEWNLSRQGALKITEDGSYKITATDKSGKQTSAESNITIADGVKATVTLDNVTIRTKDTPGIQIGSGAEVTLELLGSNSVLNDSGKSLDSGAGKLIITSESGGTLRLREEAPVILDDSITLTREDIADMMGGNFMVVINDSKDGFVIVERSDTASTEGIPDESVPLANPDAVLSSITVEGSAQLEADSDIYEGIHSYIIHADAMINGIHGWDLEALAKEVPFEKDYSNLILLTDGQQLSDCRILKSSSKKTSVIVSDAEGKVRLTESTLKNKELTEGVDTASILRTCHLSLGKDYAETFVVRFHLDQQHAGKTLEVRRMADEQIVTEAVTVSPSGTAVITAAASGDFALIEG